MLSLRRTHARANRVKERARTDAVTGTYVGIRVSDRQRDRQTDRDRVKEVLAYWSTSKRTRGTCVYFWSYRGFDAGKRGMVRCFVKGYGSMPNRRKWFDAGSKGII